MISSILIITDSGEILLSRDYRNEVDPETTVTAFTNSLKKLKDGSLKELVPVMEYQDQWIYHIWRNSIYFVAVSRLKQNSLMVIEMLTKLVSVLRHFCGVISEDSVTTNSTLIQEILLEFMDFGYVQLCSAEKLKPIVFSEPVVPTCRPPISDGVQWGLFGLEKPAVTGKASNKPFYTSRTTNESGKEEIFVDVVENLFVFIDKEGAVKRSEINGKIVLKNFVTGSIDVKLGLNKDLSIRSNQSNSGLGNSACLDYCQFHEMVNLDLFDSNRVIQFQPCQGEVDLVTYQVDSGHLNTIPFRLQYRIDGPNKAKDLKISLIMKSNVPFASKAPQITSRLRIPRGTSGIMSHVSSPTQTVEFERERSEVVWRIKEFVGGMEAKVSLLLVDAIRGQSGDSHLMELGPLAVEFELSSFLCSGLQINFMQVDDRRNHPPNVKLQRWVRLFTQHSELIDLFTKFQNLRTKEDQYQSMELQQHAGLVMQTLDESIQALENADYFFDYVLQVGRIHYKVPGFKKEYFWKIEAPFLSAVKETLGDRYTDNIASIYEIVIRFILETLVKGFESAEAAAAPK